MLKHFKIFLTGRDTPGFKQLLLKEGHIPELVKSCFFMHIGLQREVWMLILCICVEGQNFIFINPLFFKIQYSGLSSQLIKLINQINSVLLFEWELKDLIIISKHIFASDVNNNLAKIYIIKQGIWSFFTPHLWVEPLHCPLLCMTPDASTDMPTLLWMTAST